MPRPIHAAKFAARTTHGTTAATAKLARNNSDLSRDERHLGAVIAHPGSPTKFRDHVSAAQSVADQKKN
jgi:hypothetical protein